MQVRTMGLDLAKNVFEIHAVDDDGIVVARRALRRSEVLPFFRKLAWPCVVGVEACATAHYWAREISLLGHEVCWMPPAYVKPYVKRNKNDMADAEAICEAVTRPNMRFDAVKSAEQQSIPVSRREDQDARKRNRTPAPRLRGQPAVGVDPGFGVMTATAMAATVPDPEAFRSGREFAAWLGLTPRQNSSGGEQRLGA